ncbi:MAG: hypothetical protein ACYDBY_01740 [Thermoanaerobaculia bacterium]
MPRRFSPLSLAALLLASTAAVAAPPPNDTCPAAITIPGLELPFTRMLETIQATSDGDPAMPCATAAPGKSVWFAFQPATSDSYVFETAGSAPADYLPVLALYTGGCAGLAPVAGACDRGRLTSFLEAGTTYYLMVAGDPVVVNPSIRIALDGVDLCPGGPGPGGGGCGGAVSVRVGDALSARAYNELNDSLLLTGGFSWDLGQSASPATSTSPSVAFQYTAPVASTNVVLTWTPPGQSPITRQLPISVGAAGNLVAMSEEPESPAFRAAGETATLPSPGGILRLSVQRNAPEWRYNSLIPSVASTKSAAGVPYVSDLSLSNLESTETLVGLELWTAAGRREASSIRLAPKGSRTVRDVVKTAFGLEQSFGTLYISSTGAIVAGARTWAPAAGGGTNGQFALAGDVRTSASPALLRTGEVGFFPGVREDSAFRTNIGVYNVSDKECVVELEAKDDDGHTVGSKLALTVPPTRYLQEPLSRLTGSLPSGSVTLTNGSTGCFVGGVAYVIDNVTQDPFAVSQRKKP